MRGHDDVILIPLKGTIPLMLSNSCCGVKFTYQKALGNLQTPPLGGLSQTSNESLLAEFRNKVLDIDLFQAIEQVDNIISEVKNLLLKLDQTSFDPKFRELWQMLEPLMENVKQSLHQKKADQSKLEERTLAYDCLMAEITAFRTKLTAFREEIPNAQQKMEEIDSTIAEYKAKIHNLELQKASIQERERESLMKKETSFAIKKVKDSKVFQQEMATLVEHGNALDGELNDFKGKLNKLQTEFKI